MLFSLLLYFHDFHYEKVKKSGCLLKIHSLGLAPTSRFLFEGVGLLIWILTISSGYINFNTGVGEIGLEVTYLRISGLYVLRNAYTKTHAGSLAPSSKQVSLQHPVLVQSALSRQRTKNWIYQ